FEGAQHLDVIAERQRRMKPPDDVQLSNTERQSLPGDLDHFLRTILKAIRVPFLAGKGAELAAQDAVVGIVQVTIENVAGAVADLSRPHKIGDGSDGIQVLALKKPQSVLVR